MNDIQRIEGPPLYRSAMITPADVNTELRIVRVSFSSELPVVRASFWEEPWVEILGHNPNEVDLTRMRNTAPVLFDHDPNDRDSHIGVVVNAWLENGRGIADIKISKRADIDGIWQDIQDGIIANVSVGYSINQRQLIQSYKDQPSEYRVISWTPFEISLVTIPADSTVGIGRNLTQPTQNYRVYSIPSNQEPRMSNLETPAAPIPPTPAAPPVIDLNAERAAAKAEALIAERARRAEISNFCAPLRRDFPEIAELEAKALATDTDFAGFCRDFAAVRAAHAAPTVQTAPRIEAGLDHADKQRDAAVDWLLYRSNQRVINEKNGTRRGIDPVGNPFQGQTLLQLAERALLNNNIPITGLDRMALVGRAFQSTSDFPILLETTVNKTLLNAYLTAADTWSRFCKPGTASDFRAQNRYRTGSIGNYDVLNENGEYKRKAIPDGEKSSITIGTRGNIIAITRETIVNDDLGALTDLTTAIGRAGKRTIEAAVFSLLAENSGAGPTMSDGKALFHTDHSNLASTSAAPTVTSVSAARVAMAMQKDVTGLDYLDLRPALFLCPMSLGVDARVLNDAQYDPDTANKLQRPNAVRGLFRDVIDTPRLSGTAWYLFADPSEAPVIEVAFLDGNQEPYTETQNGWNVDGTEIKARLDFGVAAVDYRGAIKNAGA
jgi:hypothetical protein